MKITAGFLLLSCIGMLSNPPVVLAQAAAMETAGQGAQAQEGQTKETQEEQAEAVSKVPTEDYTAYIRPLDKLRAELSQQRALLGTVVDITTQIDQLRNQGARSDILVLLDEDLSQTERIKAVLSDKDYAPSDELALIRAEIEFLKSIYIQTLQQTGSSAITDVPKPWTLGPSNIQYVQTADAGTAGFVSISTGAGASAVLKADQSIKIAGKTILLDSVKLGAGGRILIHFVIDGNLTTVYYPQ